MQIKILNIDFSPDGGKMVMVTKRALWYKNKLSAIFGGVRTTSVEYTVGLDTQKPVLTSFSVNQRTNKAAARRNPAAALFFALHNSRVAVTTPFPRRTAWARRA